MAALDEWLKKNIPKNLPKAALGAAFFAPDIAGAATAENKLKGITKALADIWFWTSKILAPLRQALVGGWMILGFNAVSKAVHNLVRDTGSLEAALKRLQSVRGFERQFTPLVGGLSAAKTRVAELLALSARGPFKFEEIATASRNLEIFTRGALSGADATRMIGNVAIATGNGINETADAVGNFYNTLREGRPIEGAVEQLRQMGIISGSTAKQLDSMSAGGMSASVIFTTLTDSLSKTHGALKQASEDLATVSAEHEKAAEEMKARFGAPWTQAEIQSTKNMTAAMQAITPALESVSRSLSTVFTGFGSLSSKIAEVAAESPTVQAAIKAIGDAVAYLSTALLAVGSILLVTTIPAIRNLAGAIGAGIGQELFQLTGKLGLAARTAQILTGALEAIGTAAVGIGAFAGFVALAGILVNVITQVKQAIDSVQDMRRAFNEGNDAINKQISGVTTLAERHEALAKAIDQSLAAEKRYRELIAKGPPSGIGGGFQGILSFFEARRERRRARETVERAAAITPTGLGGPEAEALVRQRAQRRRAQEEEEFERARATAAPEQAIAITRQRAAILAERAQQGFRGAEVKRQLAEETAGIDLRRQKIEGSKKAAQDLIAASKQPGAKISPFEIRDAEKDIKKFDQELKRLKKEGRAIFERPTFAGTPEALEAEAQAETKLLENNKNISDEKRKQIEASILTLRASAEQARNDRDDAIATEAKSKELETQARLQQQSLEISKIRASAELEIARSQGTPGERARKEFEVTMRAIDQEMQAVRNSTNDQERLKELAAQKEERRFMERERLRALATTRLQTGLETAGVQARLAGRSEEVKRIEDIKGFISKFDQLRQQFGAGEARQLALQQQGNEIMAQIPTYIKPVADSLTRAGGGGGVAGPTGDPRLKVQERIRDLITNSNTYLAIIAGQAVEEVGAPAAAPEAAPVAGAPTPAAAAAAATGAVEGPAGAITAAGGGGAPTAPPVPRSRTQFNIGERGVITSGTQETEAQMQATVISGISGERIGTAENRLPRVPINPLTVTTGVSPISVPPTQEGGQGAVITGVLKDIWRSSEQSNEHLAAISGKREGVQ